MPTQQITLLAGETDPDGVYLDFTPPIFFDNVYDDQGLYGRAEDSLDLDGDGVFDLRFVLQVIEEDSLHLLTGPPNPYPNLRVYTLNETEVAFQSISYPIGMGQTSSGKFARALLTGEPVYTLSDWFEEHPVGLAMWQESPAASSYPVGPWYSLDQVAHLPCRLDGRLGWVRIDLEDRDAPQIISTFLMGG